MSNSKMGKIQDIVRVMKGSKSFPFLVENWETLARQLGISNHEIDSLHRTFNVEKQFQNEDVIISELLEVWKKSKRGDANMEELFEGLTECGLATMADTLKSAIVPKVEEPRRLHVNEKTCSPIEGLIKVINESTSFPSLVANWEALARQLKINDADIESLKRTFIVEKQFQNEKIIINELLEIWKRNKGTDASVEALMEAVTKCGLQKIAGPFKSTITPALNKSTKFDVNGTRTLTLEELIGRNTSDLTYQRILDALKDEDLIQPIKLLNHDVCLPTQPLCYIERTMSFKTKIDNAIFTAESTSEHVFLFKGATMDEINDAIYYQPMEASLNQLDQVTVRFMLLEEDEDFKIISKRSSQPVHLLEFAGGSYFWVKSSSGLSRVKSFMMEDGITVGEHELLTNFDSHRVLIISDKPKMGKSWALANLGRKIQETFPNTIPVLIDMSECLRSTTSHSTVQAIAAYASSNAGTKLILEQMMKRDMYKFVLIVDGYDHIVHDELNAANQLISELVELKNVKVIISTRPELKTQLEDSLNAISLELVNLTEAQTLQYFTKYWINHPKHVSKGGEVLEKFAKELYQIKRDLEDEITETEDILAVKGTMFFNWLLAEVYAESYYETEIPSKVYSVFHLYQRYLQQRFKRTSADEESWLIIKTYINAHVHQSLKFLFPTWAEKLKKFMMIGNDQFDENTLCSFGVIQNLQRNDNSPIFIDWTFAAYLLAEFLAKNIGRCGSCIEFVFNEILGLSNAGIEAPVLRYPQLAFFMEKLLEEYLKHHYIDHTMISMYLQGIEFDILELPQIIHACRYRGLFTLTNFTNDVLMLMTNNTRDSSQSEEIFPFKYDIAPLKTAVSHGDSITVMKLLNTVNHNQLQDLKFLVHDCVRESVSNEDSVIEEKLEILDNLFSQNPDWLDEELDGCIPLLQNQVHFRLIQKLVYLGELVDWGVGINATTADQQTILHRAGDRVNSEMISCVISKGFRLINHPDSSGMTPLMSAVKHGVIDDETLQSFYNSGADFNCSDASGRSLLFYAFLTENSEFIDKVISFGADVNRLGKEKNSLGHHIVMHAREVKLDCRKFLSILELLASKGFKKMNEENEQGSTPLDLANQLMQDFFREKGGSRKAL